MTGFWAHLTDEQKVAALAYRGPENHGSVEYMRQLATEAAHGESNGPSSMWDWISPARIKRPYEAK